jgi:hypothetical protein
LNETGLAASDGTDPFFDQAGLQILSSLHVCTEANLICFWIWAFL